MINDSQKIQRLNRKLKIQDKQIEQLRTKVFALQEALIRNNSLAICDLDHPLAAISPIVARFFPESRSTVIAFGGMLKMLGMPPAEFLKTFTSKQVNTIFVKDFQQCWYQQGLLGLTSGIEETAALIKQQIPADQENVYTIGTSAGGFAAILFGTLMGADKIMAFGPQTIVTKEEFETFKSIDSRLNDIDLNGQFLDLQKLLNTTAHNGEVHIHFSEGHKDDKLAAERLSGINNVHLYPWQTDNHNIAGWLKKADKLEAIFTGTLGV